MSLHRPPTASAWLLAIALTLGIAGCGSPSPRSTGRTASYALQDTASTPLGLGGRAGGGAVIPG